MEELKVLLLLWIFWAWSPSPEKNVKKQGLFSGISASSGTGEQAVYRLFLNPFEQARNLRVVKLKK
ncbi:hypothetical protein [Nitrosomonas sp.]|uniref:hypothetical protein n=1 Tax=Nitrosomonas sp. TaxID=42353 RepID=UPI00261B4BB1|nr:hypothetical protein [Nitrosomonas sp.]MCW5602739.1 hypothetical protein [Nitrosomonas sp.]